MRNWTRRTISSLFLCRKLHLFLGKSTQTASTRAALLDSNMHRIICRLGLRPRPQAGAHSAPPDPLALFRGPTSKAKGEEGRGEKAKRGERKEGRAFFALERKKRKVGTCGLSVCLSVCPSATHRLSNKHFLSHLKYVATLLCNLSSMACFAGISVSQGSVATYARCGGSFNSYI